MAGVGFLRSLREKTDLGGRLALLGSDGLCVFAHSVHCMECAREAGPHGELFFFLIQKEPATVPGSETFSPFFNADIRTRLFSADVLKKCALVALHVIVEGRGGEDGCHTPDLGDEWV